MGEGGSHFPFHFLRALLVRRSTSEPGAQTLTMADTYAVVQKRGTSSTAGAGAGSGARTGGPDAERLYSHVTPRALRPGAQAEDNARGAPPARGESRPALGAGAPERPGWG